MYQLSEQSTTFRKIGENENEQCIDEKYIDTLFNMNIEFSSEVKKIQKYFNDRNIIPTNNWDNYHWVMLCIAYFLSFDYKITDTEYWKKPNDKNGSEISVTTLFQKQSFWIAYISEQMFQSQPKKRDWTKGEFSEYIRTIAHNGALLLKQRYEQFFELYKEDKWKSRSEFLKELADIATKNMPKEKPVLGTPKPDTTPTIKNDISGSLKDILQKCKIPVESISFSTNGVRYDIYEIKLSHSIELEKKTTDIASHLGLSENSVIAGGQVIGKPLTQFIKILRAKNEWHSFGKNEFQAALQQYNGNYELPVCIGLDEQGKPVFRDFYDAPHAIIGGTTKSGKSVAVKVILHSLLKLTPQEKLQVIILDPKKLDYKSIQQQYSNIRLITDSHQMLEEINHLAEEMEKRYAHLENQGVANLTDIAVDKRPFTFQVLIVDEVADLLMTNKEVAEPLTRLAQKARAVGIHLLLATQRPEVKALGELGAILRANLPTKIALKVDSVANSKIILNEDGAEKLIGAGDRFVKWNNDEKIFLHGYNI